MSCELAENRTEVNSGSAPRSAYRSHNKYVLRAEGSKLWVKDHKGIACVMIYLS